MPSSAYVPSAGQPTCTCPTCCNTQIVDADPVDNLASPVLADSGLLTLKIPLLSSAAVGIGGFDFTLDYYPDTTTTSSGGGGVGIGFNFTQNIVIVPATGNDVYLQLGNNTQELFTSSDGITFSSAGNKTAAVLFRTGMGTSADQFTLVSRKGVVSVFWGLYSSIATPGRIKSFTDRFGNQQVLNWAAMGSGPAVVRLTSVIDSYGRETTLAFYGPSQNYALQQVTDYLGRQVNLQFDSMGHLTAVVGPSINRGANNDANTFPNGTAFVFAWDTGNSRPERRNDLIAVYHPNQVAPYIDATRTVDVAAVLASATARQQIAYYNDPTDAFQYGKVQQVIESASGSGSVGAGAYGYMYVNTGLPANLIDPSSPIVSETVATDRAGNQVVYDFTAAGVIARKLVYATRGKNSLQASSWTTWTKYNSLNQDILTVTPEGNSIVKCYEDATNTISFGGVPYARRFGLLKSVTRLHGNSIGIPCRPGSGGQTQLTELYFNDPIFNQQCAMIEVRGNPIDASGDYFPPQNLGAAPTDADRSRYGTITFFDFQKDAAATVQNDPAVQALCFPGLDPTDAYTQIGDLLAFVNTQMTATDGSGGTPDGFQMQLGDINGQGTGYGTAADATHIGNVVKVQHPSVRQLIPNVAPAYAKTVLFDAPIAYWRLDEASGTTAADSSGNGNAASYAGSYALGQPGAIARDPDTSVGFTAGYAEAPASDSLGSALTQLSVECWAKYSGGAVAGIVWHGFDDAANCYRIFVDSGNYYFILGPWYGSPAAVAAPVPDSGWHHVAMTWDGTTLTAYVDGQPVGTGTGTAYVASNDITGIGCGNIGTYNYYFEGDLDEPAIYDYALSAERILAHYNAGTGADAWVWLEQPRIELFTSNLRGQGTTRTDAEGNVTVTVRYPQNDPEGAAQFLVPSLSNKQYGYVKEIHVDADPATVMTLLGPDADLLAFTGNIIPRANTPGVYQDLVTRYQASGTAGGQGGCASCAYDPLGNPLSITDPRGHTTTIARNELGEPYCTTSPAPYSYQVETSYDANRNVIQVDTRDVVVKFASDDPADPRFATFVPSGSGSTANLPTMPGPGGAVRPGWFSNLYLFDLLDNRIQQDIDCTGSSVSTVEDAAASLITGFAFDFNQNLVKITKPLGTTIEYDHDERNLKIATRVGGPSGSVTIMAYDGNKNLTDMIGPATRGTAAQTLSAIIGDAFGGSSSVTFSGDWVVQNNFDGFDRLVDSTDAVGGMVLNTFDPDGRTIASQSLGTPGGPTPTDRSGSSNILLASSEARFDEAGRQYEAQRDIFLDGGTYYMGVPGNVPSGRAVTHTGGGLAINSTANNHTDTVTLTAGGRSYVLSRTVFDRADRMTATATDNGAVATVTLDGAGRALAAQDALGNIVQNTFDANSNVTFTTRIEKCTISDSIAAESFSIAFAIDVLNRTIITMQQGPDGSLNTNWMACCTWPVLPPTLFTFTGFDSRNNRTNLVDPKQNTTIWDFDGASRQLREKRHLRPSGDGTTAIYATVLTQTAYDANSNTLRLVDNNGGTTAWLYDLLDRNTVMQFHDGSTRTNVFDAASDVIGYTDENGSVFANTWDVLGRKTAVDITRATGVVGTTTQAFDFDGLSRVTFCRDGVGGMNADVGFTYDSISRILEEQQTYAGDTRYVTHNAWTSYPATGFTFPNNRRTTTGFDALYRKNAINETSGGASIAAWQFFGYRTATVTLGNGIVMSFMNNAQTRSAVQLGQTTPAWGDISTDHLGYDGSGRLIGKRHILSGSVLVGFTAAYDPASNKLFERALHAESRSALYGMDSMDRLLNYSRGVLASGGGSITTVITLPNTDSQRNYALDGLGNWKNTAYTPVALPPGLDVRTHNKLNQITVFDAPSAPTPILYDQGNNAGLPPQKGNGNIIDDGTRINVFDALNRLVSVNRVSDGSPIGAYIYDALGRRIIRAVANGGVHNVTPFPNGVSRYLLNGQQIVEELDGVAGSATLQYFWGHYIDELVQLKALASIGPQPLSAGNYYLLSDLLYRSAALTGSTGMVVEAYDTDAYGNTLLFSGPGTDGLWFTDDDVQAAYSACRYVFTGREWDAESGLCFYRARSYHAGLGRFTSRDPIAYLGGVNLYGFLGAKPTIYVDAFGLVGQDLRQIDEICERYELNKAGRQALHNAMQGCKDASGKVPADELEELAAEINEHKKYLLPGAIPGAGGASGFIDSRFLGANPMGVASAGTLFSGAYLAIRGSADALDIDTEMSQETQRMEALDRRIAQIRFRMRLAGKCNCPDPAPRNLSLARDPSDVGEPSPGGAFDFGLGQGAGQGAGNGAGQAPGGTLDGLSPSPLDPTQPGLPPVQLYLNLQSQPDASGRVGSAGVIFNF